MILCGVVYKIVVARYLTLIASQPKAQTVPSSTGTMQRSTNPNPCLLAILLIVCSSSSGANLVFHYPPKPKPTPANAAPRHHLQFPTNTVSGSSSQSSLSLSNSSDDDSDDRQSRTTARGARTATEGSDSGSKSRSRLRPDEEEEKGKKTDDKDEDVRVLGFNEEFLAGLLAPKERMCKTKFELSVDDMVFLGYPLHVRPDGTWRRQRKRRNREKVGRMDSVGGEQEEEESGVIDGGHEDDADDEKDEEDEGDEDGSQSGGAGNMIMFHVVFVLNPPELEYHSRTQEMFDYVVKRFSRALKYEQAKDGYVWRESEKIVRIKEKAGHGGISVLFTLPNLDCLLKNWMRRGHFCGTVERYIGPKQPGICNLENLHRYFAVQDSPRFPE